MKWLIERLSEPSTYAGAAVIAASAPTLLENMAAGAVQDGLTGAAIAAGMSLLSIFMRESNGRM